MSHPLLVGVDPHRKTNTVCMMDQEGREACDRFTVQNNRPGTAAFVREVAQRVVEGEFDAIHIAFHIPTYGLGYSRAIIGKCNQRHVVSPRLSPTITGSWSEDLYAPGLYSPGWL